MIITWSRDSHVLSVSCMGGVDAAALCVYNSRLLSILKWFSTNENVKYSLFEFVYLLAVFHVAQKLT